MLDMTLRIRPRKAVVCLAVAVAALSPLFVASPARTSVSREGGARILLSIPLETAPGNKVVLYTVRGGDGALCGFVEFLDKRDRSVEAPPLRTPPNCRFPASSDFTAPITTNIMWEHIYGVPYVRPLPRSYRKTVIIEVHGQIRPGANVKSLALVSATTREPLVLSHGFYLATFTRAASSTFAYPPGGPYRLVAYDAKRQIVYEEKLKTLPHPPK